MYVHTTCLDLSEALSGHYPLDLSPGCTLSAHLVWGYGEWYLSEAL